MTIDHSCGKYFLDFRPLAIEDGIVVTDSNVFAYYQHNIEGLDSIVLTPGEQTKSMSSYEDLCRALVKKGATRKSKLVAFGGGVIGDLVGFVAATYMRGIDYIQVPTTLLAQIDSSVGGKTGIDLPEGKNLIGAFYPPKEVHIDVSLLETLPIREFQSGLAEVIKTGIIQSQALTTSLMQKPLTQGDDRILSTVQECVQIKARIVQEDEFETKGIRAQLNFGHTIGHAIEQITKYSKYTHGEAIAIGMVVETMIAERLGIADKELTSKVKFLMVGHGLPTKAVELKEAELIIAAMRKDKKSTKGELSMSLVKSIGECELVANIEEGVVTEVLHEFAKG